MLLLGSTSPRRKQILSYFRIPFSIQSSSFDESQISTKLDPVTYVETLAKEKSDAIALEKGSTLLTADTTVSLGSHLLGKPQSIDEAVEMLCMLSGKTHLVTTGVCVRFQNAQLIESETTKVTFLPLNEKKARAYATHFSVLDKAGSYAIQDGGAIIVEKIDGCFYNVMGLPLQTTVRLLKKAGLDVWNVLGNS